MNSYPVPPLSLPDAAMHRKMLAQSIALIMTGKMNAVTSITLAPSATTTTVADSRIGAYSALIFTPLTASAAVAQAGLYVSSRNNGNATLTHTSSAAADQTFSLVIIG